MGRFKKWTWEESLVDENGQLSEIGSPEMTPALISNRGLVRVVHIRIRMVETKKNWFVVAVDEESVNIVFHSFDDGELINF
jgi:hypothetical protein